MASRPYLSTGAALASAALIVAATPAVLPTEEVAKDAAAAVASVRISQLPYQLTTLTLDDLISAFYNGYGEKVTDDVTVNGLSGVLYYVIDTELASNTDLDNYFFEVSPGYAVEQALYEVFGTDSAVGQVVNLIFNTQSVVSSAIIDIAKSTFGEDSVVYNAVNYYFNGYEDSSVGVASVVHYLVDTVTSALTATSTTTATADETTTETTAVTAVADTTTATSDSTADTAVADTTTTVAEKSTAATATDSSAAASVDTAATEDSATASADTTAATVATAESTTATEKSATAAATTTADTAADTATATATADTTTTTTTTTEDNSLVRLSKKFSPTLKSDSTSKSFDAVSRALKDFPTSTAKTATDTGEDSSDSTSSSASDSASTSK